MLDNSFDSIEVDVDAVRDLAADSDWHKKIKEKNKKTALIFGAAVLLLTIARVVLVRFCVDPDIHFYTVTNVRIFDYAVVAVIVAIYIGAIFFYKYKIDAGSYSAMTHSVVQGTQTLVFTAAASGFLLAASAVLQIWTVVADEQSIMSYIRANPWDIFIFVAAILSSVYFFRTAARNSDISENEIKYSQRYIFISMMPIIWSLLNTFKIFFDMSRSVNSPVRVYELMCFLALSLYFVSETRMIVGRRGLAKYFTFAYIAMLITALSAAPNLILSSFWIMRTNDGPIVYAVQISFVLYIAARLYSQLRYGNFGLQSDYDDYNE